MTLWIALGLSIVLFTMLELKTSRVDGALVRVHPYRRLMSVIMPTRNESVVYFDSDIDATTLLGWLEEHKANRSADMTACLVAACAIGLHAVPRMNRFVVGRRVYQRDGRWITFSMKRKKLDQTAKISAVKMKMHDGDSFWDLVERMNERVGVERSGKRTAQDIEYAIFNAMPRIALQGVRHLARVVDYFNLLPRWFVEGDGMYTSAVVANLGSLGMGRAYHHLYEWGTCTNFVMVGAVEERAVVVDGNIVVRKILPIRYAFDERVEDGLTAGKGVEAVKCILENPAPYLNDQPLTEAWDQAQNPMEQPARQTA